MFREIKWSAAEKKIARCAFDKAYSSEMEFIKQTVYDKVAGIKDNRDIWKLHDYLSDCRRQIDSKYDYRYSVLLTIFAKLLSEGYIGLDDLAGLSEEKIEIIEKFYSI